MTTLSKSSLQLAGPKTYLSPDSRKETAQLRCNEFVLGWEWLPAVAAEAAMAESAPATIIAAGCRSHKKSLKFPIKSDCRAAHRLAVIPADSAHAGWRRGVDMDVLVEGEFLIETNAAVGHRVDGGSGGGEKIELVGDQDKGDGQLEQDLISRVRVRVSSPLTGSSKSSARAPWQAPSLATPDAFHRRIA